MTPAKEFVFPDLLPQRSDPLIQTELRARRQTSPAVASATIHFTFLHEGVLRLLLSRLGRQIWDLAVYWRYGCWLWEADTETALEMDSRWNATESQIGAGEITLAAWGGNAGRLLENALEMLQGIPLWQRPRIEQSGNSAGGLAQGHQDLRAGGRNSSSLQDDGVPSLVEMFGDEVLNYRKALMALCEIGDYCDTHQTNTVPQKIIAVGTARSTVTGYLDRLEILFATYFDSRKLPRMDLFLERGRSKGIKISARCKTAILEARAYRRYYLLLGK
jgi:hypothetical protein